MCRESWEWEWTRTFDPVRFDAFTRLLARPDPRGLPGRGHVIRCHGEPERRGTPARAAQGRREP
jgi:hypothetical protein